jgi:hypothetical protein
VRNKIPTCCNSVLPRTHFMAKSGLDFLNFEIERVAPTQQGCSNIKGC